MSKIITALKIIYHPAIIGVNLAISTSGATYITYVSEQPVAYHKINEGIDVFKYLFLTLLIWPVMLLMYIAAHTSAYFNSNNKG